MSKKFTLTIPRSLSDMNLGQYQQYAKIVDKDMTLEEKIIETIRVFCGGKKEHIMMIDYSEAESIYEHLMLVLDTYTPLIRKFSMVDIKGKKVHFGFVPKLEEITMGEFVDLDDTITDLDKMHFAMSVLYRPISFERKNHYLIKRYKGYNETAEAFKTMPLNVALGAMVFFYRLGNELLSYMTDYLAQEAEQQEGQVHKVLQENGVGISQFTHSLKEISETLMTLPNFHIKSA